MTKAELDVLERDVEDARGRLRLDLARLRAPGAMDRMKDDVTGRVTGAAQDTAHRVLDEIKARAAANPVAALAIGAGLAWRFAHRPPIATLLVGAGLVALFKTNPQERYVGADFVERAGEFAGTVKETVSEKIDELSHSEFAARASELSGTVATKASEVGGTVAAKASELGGTVRQKAGEMSGTVKETVGQWSARTGEFASEAAAEASSAANSLARDSRRVAAAVNQDRDTYLLGAAAIALAAAVGISYQRSAN
jgi:transposase